MQIPMKKWLALAATTATLVQ